MGGVGRAAVPLAFICVSRLCGLRGSLILLAKSIPYKFGRPLVDRICFLEKVASATFSTRCPGRNAPDFLALVAAAPAGMVVVGASAVVIAAASAGEQENQDDDPPDVVAAAKTVVTAHNKPSAYFI